AEADSKRLDREEATAAKKKTEAAEKASAAGDSDARLVAAEKRLAELEGKEQREQKRASLEKWVTGISAGIAKEDLAKDLDDPAREILTKLAMGHGALDRQLDAGKAVESFVKDAGAVIDKLAEVKAEARLVEWKRDFLAGKVRAATTTAGEGATGAPPDHGGEKHDASDLDSGKTKDRALQRQKLRAAGV
ncbi:MAG: hypothetical protein KAU28_03120, partial [Phycisphaerae bacterium]|nr:hypothetical protein [Phycisphaerae bacterium]